MSLDIAQRAGDDGVAEIRVLARVAVARAMAAASRGVRPDGDLRTSLKSVCDAARGRGLQAEAVVLVVKESWRHLVDPQLIERHLADAALEKLITMCITEFYAHSDDKARS
jgi:hypothetical protein